MEAISNVNASNFGQDQCFYILSILYGILSIYALVQLVRIQLIVFEYLWNTQKLFHFLNFLVHGARSLVFVFGHDVQRLQSQIIQHILLDIPSLGFMTNYALLVFFWANIYYTVRHEISTDDLRRNFSIINAIIYIIQIALWWKPNLVFVNLSKLYIAGVSLLVALCFLLYGGRLFILLYRVPKVSYSRRTRLQEVRTLGTVCFTCFLIRCVMICFDAFDKAGDDRVILDRPVFNFVYYLLVEIVPSSIVLFTLRRLPREREIS